MSGPYRLASLPETATPFLLKRRHLLDWVQSAIADALHQFPGDLRIEANLSNMKQELEPLLSQCCGGPLKTWLLDDIGLCAAWIGSFLRS